MLSLFFFFAFYETGNDLMKTNSHCQKSKVCLFQTWPQTCQTGEIQGLLAPPLYQSHCVRQVTHQTSGHRVELLRGLLAAFHSPGERRCSGSCSASPRRRRLAPGTRWSCSESRLAPQAFQFPGRRSAWLPGSQRHIPIKKKKQFGTKTAKWLKVRASMTNVGKKMTKLRGKKNKNCWALFNHWSKKWSRKRHFIHLLTFTQLSLWR